MGMSHIDIEIANVSAPERRETVHFLVDSGATYSVVPGELLERLGIAPHATQRFNLANGEQITRKKGTALFKLGDRTGGADVIFGEPGDSNLLGAFTLETLGLALDPLRREVRELPLVLR